MNVNEFSFILDPAPGKGLGVFATHDIPEGTKIHFFPEGHEHRKMRTEEIPEPFLKYCTAESDDTWLAPRDFSRMEIAWYLNHSDVPNLTRLRPGLWRVTRAIQKGEEVTIDYNIFGEPEHLKEDYYA